MKYAYKQLLIAIMNTKVYWWIIMRVIPIIRLSTYYTSFRGWKYKRGYERLEVGDIIVSVDRKKLTTLLVPGAFTHSALCVDRRFDTEFEVAEMTHHNFTRSCFFDICREADRVVILRCMDFDDEYIDKVVEKCLSFKDAEYDVEFSSGVKALYCSEMVRESDFEYRLQVSLEDIAGLGMKYISPTGLSEAKNVAWIWDSDRETN